MRILPLLVLNREKNKEQENYGVWGEPESSSLVLCSRWSTQVTAVTALVVRNHISNRVTNKFKTWLHDCKYPQWKYQALDQIDCCEVNIKIRQAINLKVTTPRINVEKGLNEFFLIFTIPSFREALWKPNDLYDIAYAKAELCYKPPSF